MLKSLAAVTLTAIVLASAANAAESDVVNTWSSTAQNGFFYDQGAYVKTGVVPHVMRRTDVSNIVSRTPSGDATHDKGVYAKMVEVPHTMPSAERHVHSATPAPGLYQDEGAYHGLR